MRPNATPVKKMADGLKSAIPGLKEAVNAIDKEAKKAAHKAQRLANENLDKMLSKVKLFDKIQTTLKTLATTVRKNEKGIQKLLTSDKFCTMKSHDRASSMAKLLGADLRKVDLAGFNPGLLDGLLITSAHAASGPTSFSVGISAGPTDDHINIGVALDYVFDSTGKSAFYLGASIGATTGANSAMDVSLNVAIMPNTAYNEAGGSSISLGYGADLGKAVSVSPDISMNVNWNSKAHPVTFGGISLGFGKGGDTASLDFSGSFSQSVLIADLK